MCLRAAQRPECKDNAGSSRHKGGVAFLAPVAPVRVGRLPVDGCVLAAWSPRWLLLHTHPPFLCRPSLGFQVLG